jgi:hypothetical protein
LDKSSSLVVSEAPRRSTSSLDAKSVSTVSFGGERYERVAIDVSGYAYPERTGEYDDDNWLRVQVSVAAGSFRVSYDAMFQVAELEKFESQLSSLYKSPEQTVFFEALEGQLSLELSGNRLGAVTLRGIAEDQPGIGNRLHFSLKLDQTQVGSAVQQLRDILVLYPVRSV